MRISRRIQLAGLVALAGTGAAGQAAADDLTISTATTAPVFTATASGGDEGDITVESGGTITIGVTNTAAITVNSNNDVSNAGILASTNQNGTGGIRIQNGFAGTITHSGELNFTDGYVLTDTDSDGDLDGEFATGSGRYGILLDPGTFTGNISTTGSFNIEGNGSYGIRLQGLLDGDGTTTGNLSTRGAVSVIGDDSVAVWVEGGVTGDVLIRSAITALGEDAQGVVVDGDVDGEMRLNGMWRSTGFNAVNRGYTATLDAGDDDLLGGSTLVVRGNVAGGITFEGIGQVDDDDDDGDGTNDEPDDNNTASLISFGSAPAVLIQGDAAAIVMSGTSAPGGYGIHNLGEITGNGTYANFASTGMLIEGINGGSVTTNNGLNNEGSFLGVAFEETATGLHIGSNAEVPTINNIGTINATATTQGTDSARALHIDADATGVYTLNNIGGISAQVMGETSDAVAVRDLSGTLSVINNTGIIFSQVVAQDTDTVTGRAIAIDVSSNSSGVIVTQEENLDDEDALIVIRGDILFGTGADTLDLEFGSMSGSIEFNTGLDAFNIDNGAIFTGQIVDDGGLDIHVFDGELNLTGGNAVINDFTLDDNGVLNVTLSGDPGDDPLIEALGTVTFGTDSVVVPVVPTGLIETSQVFLTAGSMFGGNNVTGAVTGEGTPFVYNLDVALTSPLAAEGDANGLEATYTLKTATQLGMTQNQTAAYAAIIDALRQDDNASNAFVTLEDSDAFYDAYEDLMPSYASAAAEIATTAIQQSQSATSNRLAATRLHSLDEVSVWAQEIGYGLNREPPTTNGQEFRGHGFGMAFGIDGPLDNGGLFGLSGAFLTSEVEEPARPDGEIAATFGQVNAYLGTAMGAFDLDFIAGGGVGRMQSRRFVEIADTFAAQTEADWWAYEGHGAARISAPMTVSEWFVMTPQAALTYTVLNEQSYTEEGGGDAIDYEVDSTTSQRLWGDVGVEFSGRFRSGQRGIIAPRLFAGYRANLIDEEAERTFRVVSTGDEFTLTDEALGSGGPLVGVGLDFSNGYSTIALGYEGEFGEQIERHSLNVSVRFRF